MIQKANAKPLVEEEQASEVSHYLGRPWSYWLPQQIMVELHWATRMTGVTWMPRTRTAAEIALMSNMMYSGGGYMPIFQNWVKQCPCCMEVLYFRTLC